MSSGWRAFRSSMAGAVSGANSTLVPLKSRAKLALAN
jgi:hypothetical protein